MSLERLLLQTQERFPRYHRSRVEIAPLEKGGSDRKYYRICAGDESPVILVKYSSQKEENRHYVEIAKFLAASGLNVPAIYFHDESEGLIWMQDLGDEDLWSWRGAAWEQRRALYESALYEVSKLHIVATRDLPNSGLRLEREFSEQLYLWEQQYFFDNCLRAHFGLAEMAVRRYSELPTMREIAARLASLPRVLVHRDFQSQNILIRDEDAWLIDFQGMRPGLPQYDVASLLYDPYVDLAGSERSLLLEWKLSATSTRYFTFVPSSASCRRSAHTAFLDFKRAVPTFSHISRLHAAPSVRWRLVLMGWMNSLPCLIRSHEN
jgi:N-acetylmuramate 1-kinase